MARIKVRVKKDSKAAKVIEEIKSKKEEIKMKMINLERISEEQLEQERNPNYKYFNIEPMIPKEKAQYLIDKFTPHAYGVWDKNGSKEERYHSKQCALIAVDEIIEQWEYVDTYLADLGGKLNPNLKYWQETKQEILKL